MSLVRPNAFTPPVISNGFYRLTRKCRTGLNDDSYFTEGTIVEVTNIRHADDSREYYTIRFQDESGLEVDYDPHGNGRYEDYDVRMFEKTPAIMSLEDDLLYEPTTFELRADFFNEMRKEHPFRWLLCKTWYESKVYEWLLLFSLITCIPMFILTVRALVGIMSMYSLLWMFLVWVIGIMPLCIAPMCVADFHRNKIDAQAESLRKAILDSNALTREKLFNLENVDYEDTLDANMCFAEAPLKTIQRVQEFLNQYGEEEEFHGLKLFHTRKVEDENFVVNRY